MSNVFQAEKDCPAIKRATRAFVDTFLSEALPGMQLAARGCGYALAVHGSLARDIDLIAVPPSADHHLAGELPRNRPQHHAESGKRR